MEKGIRDGKKVENNGFFKGMAMFILAFFSSTILMVIGLWGFIMSIKAVSLLPMFGGITLFLLAFFAVVKKKQRKKILYLLTAANIIIFFTVLIALFENLPLNGDIKTEHLVISQILSLSWCAIYFLVGVIVFIRRKKQAV